jgi:hypothetical protein
MSDVIPGPAEGRSPESINTTREYGFRARRFAAPRNDYLVLMDGTNYCSFGCSLR